MIRDSLNKSEERARTDTLTGLPNRRALEEFFRTAQIAAMEKGEPLSVLLIDIDHFKMFNDDFGHGVGDQVLRLMAKVLRERVRGSRSPGSIRRGRTDRRASRGRTRDLLRCCRAYSPLRSRSAASPAARRGRFFPASRFRSALDSFSCGESMADLIDRCDRALYLAKKSGRNRVVTENDLDRELAAG